MRFFHIVKQNRKPVEWSMNIQSKMKTRDAKNNPVTAVLVSVLVMFLLSCLFLLLLAALLYKFDLSESAVKVGIVVIYIVSGVIGGFFMGKIMKTQKFLSPHHIYSKLSDFLFTDLISAPNESISTFKFSFSNVYLISVSSSYRHFISHLPVTAHFSLLLHYNLTFP